MWGRTRRAWRAARDILARLRSAARRAWPATLVCLILILFIALPGLPSDQVRESLLDYVDADGSSTLSWARYVLTLLTLLLLAASLCFWARATVGEGGKAEPFHWLVWIIPFGATAILMFRVFLSVGHAPYALMSLGIVLAGALPFGSRRMRTRLFASRTSPSHRWQLPSLALVALAVLLFGFGGDLSISAAQSIGPLNLLLLFAFALGTILSGLLLLGRRSGMPVILLLLAAAFTFSYLDWNDNHPIRGQRGPLRSGSFEEAFATWRATRPDDKLYSQYPVILVSSEGGGIRAAYFTAITLARLVDHCPRIANHIFAVSGVSGGAVGATVFAAALQADPPDTDDPRCSMSDKAEPRYERRVSAVLQSDHLSPLLARLAFPDFLQRFLPFPVDAFDRQLGLERSLEMSFQREFGSDLLARSVYAIGPSRQRPAVPYLILSTTWVDSGQRVPVAPFSFLGEDFNKLISFYELDPGFDLPASAAAGASARFPFVSPAGYIGKGGGKLRFVDGGYVDNSGAETVIEAVRDLIASNGGTWRKEDDPRFGFILLHIGNSPQCAPLQADLEHCRRAYEMPMSGGLGEAFSPLRAVMGARQAQADLTVRRWEREVTRLQDAGKPHLFRRVQMYDRGTPVPLGWLLSRRVTDELRVQLEAGGYGPECETQIGIENGCQLAGVIEDMEFFRVPPPQ